MLLFIQIETRAHPIRSFLFVRALSFSCVHLSRARARSLSPPPPLPLLPSCASTLRCPGHLNGIKDDVSGQTCGVTQGCVQDKVVQDKRAGGGQSKNKNKNNNNNNNNNNKANTGRGKNPKDGVKRSKARAEVRTRSARHFCLGFCLVARHSIADRPGSHAAASNDIKSHAPSAHIPPCLFRISPYPFLFARAFQPEEDRAAEEAKASSDAEELAKKKRFCKRCCNEVGTEPGSKSTVAFASHHTISVRMCSTRSDVDQQFRSAV